MTLQPYRLGAERHDYYLEAWKRLRTRRLVRRVAVGVLVYTLVTVIVFACKTPNVPRPRDAWSAMAQAFPVWEQVGLGLGVVFLVLTAVFARYLVPFLCPRCEQPFFHGLLMEIGFTKNCVNCHVAVDTPTMSSDVLTDTGTNAAADTFTE